MTSRIAVIGGGASGLAAAWMLDPAHDVQLYEGADTLGGHVRTVGGNVPCARLPAGVRLDAGVVEFGADAFPAFHAWMRALGVPVAPVPDAGGTSLYRADGRHFHSPDALRAEHPDALGRARGLLDLLPLALRLRRFRAALAHADRGPIGAQLGDDDLSVWVRCLLMYAYSLHDAEVPDLAAAIAAPMLRDFLGGGRWTHIPGGVATYVDAVRATLRRAPRVGARVTAVRRGADGVRIHFEDGTRAEADQVVLAVPPHRVLDLLPDADAREHAAYDAHRGHTVETVLHTDLGPYRRRGAHAPSEFDLFEHADGHHGYNAYLNRLADLPPDAPAHGLAFDMGDEIAPSTVLHRQHHDVGCYSAAALAGRAALRAWNGHRRTFHVGAWLGDGLHEGAVRSAAEVAARLGGRALAFTPAPTRR